MLLSNLKHSFRVWKANRHEKKKEKKRSPKWSTVRENHLKANPTCAACRSKKNLQVHHIKPFHLFPQDELVLTNLLTLCMDTHECHLNLGHGDSFKAFNPDVLAHVEIANHYRLPREEINKLAKLSRQFNKPPSPNT